MTALDSDTARLGNPALSSEAPHAPAPARTSSRPAVSRDTTLDILRGWAIVLMVLNHVGPRTRICAIAHVTWYVTAANWFVALSGVVLGMVCASRLRREGLRATYRRVLLRGRTIWAVHCVLLLLVIFVHERMGVLRDVPSVAAVGGWLNVLWKVPALRIKSNEFMNILPMYVIFLCLTPVALEFLRRGKTTWLLLASLTLYLFAQRYPHWGRIADPASGKQVFSIEAWQFIYVGGLCVGYYRDRIEKELWPRHRHWLLPLAITLFASIFVFAQLQRPTLAWLGLAVPSAGPLFWGKLTAAPGQTVYFIATLIVSYWVVRRVQQGANPRLLKLFEPLETIGRYSLYCFLVHLAFALTARAVDLDDRSLWLQEIVAIGSVIAVYAMAKYRVLANIIPN
jgi:hypothetical protein